MGKNKMECYSYNSALPCCSRKEHTVKVLLISISSWRSKEMIVSSKRRQI